ncbi:MAG: hypothetical protein KC503_17930 [Myxococcales bacterium]|nr:hypothetical protein [Myxococcales bacterium]
MNSRLRVCLVELDGRPSRRLVAARRTLARFVTDVRAANPRAAVDLVITSPRVGDALPRDCAMYIVTGGRVPLEDSGRAAPQLDQPWTDGLRALLDDIACATRAERPQLLALGLGHALLASHFELGHLVEWDGERAGVTRFALTPAGRHAFCLPRTARALWAFESRRVGVADLDNRRLAQLGGARLLADPTVHDSFGVRLFDAVTSLPFLPEADPATVAAWAKTRSEDASALDRRHYQRTLKLARDPLALGRTCSLVLPGWLRDSYNAIARHYLLRRLPLLCDRAAIGTTPSYHDMQMLSGSYY